LCIPPKHHGQVNHRERSVVPTKGLAGSTSLHGTAKGNGKFFYES
jgi:hypothetical protein